MMTIYTFIKTLSECIVMLLMMTMNGYVLLTIALGFSIGYVLFRA
jgi:hypothetical protein